MVTSSFSSNNIPEYYKLILSVFSPFSKFWFPFYPPTMKLAPQGKKHLTHVPTKAPSEVTQAVTGKEFIGALLQELCRGQN